MIYIVVFLNILIANKELLLFFGHVYHFSQKIKVGSLLLFMVHSIWKKLEWQKKVEYSLFYGLISVHTVIARGVRKLENGAPLPVIFDILVFG